MEIKKSFYAKGWFAGLMLLLFPPIGIVLLWVFHRKHKVLNTALSAIFGLFFLIFTITVFSSQSEREETVQQNTERSSQESLQSEQDEESNLGDMVSAEMVNIEPTTPTNRVDSSLADTLSTEVEQTETTLSAPLVENLPSDVIEMDFYQLYEDYANNKVGADKKYKDKWLKLTGMVEKIDRVLGGAPYITFRVDDYSAIHFTFKKSEEDNIAELSKYQTVAIVGICSDFSFDNVYLKDCYLVDAHFESDGQGGDYDDDDYYDSSAEWYYDGYYDQEDYDDLSYYAMSEDYYVTYVNDGFALTLPSRSQLTAYVYRESVDPYSISQVEAAPTEKIYEINLVSSAHLTVLLNIFENEGYSYNEIDRVTVSNADSAYLIKSVSDDLFDWSTYELTVLRGNLIYILETTYNPYNVEMDKAKGITDFSYDREHFKEIMDVFETMIDTFALTEDQVDFETIASGQTFLYEKVTNLIR